MSDDTPREVQLQQAAAYAGLIAIGQDDKIETPDRIAAYRSVLQFTQPGYFEPAEILDDEMP